MPSDRRKAAHKNERRRAARIRAHSLQHLSGHCTVSNTTRFVHIPIGDAKEFYKKGIAIWFGASPWRHMMGVWWMRVICGSFWWRLKAIRFNFIFTARQNFGWCEPHLKADYRNHRTRTTAPDAPTVPLDALKSKPQS